MPLGFALLLCALVLTIFGVASPIVRQLKISVWLIMAMFIAMFALGLAGTANFTPEFSFQPALLVPMIFAVILFARMNWMKQRLIALCCALASGFGAYAIQRLILDSTDFFEPGLILGFAIALISVLLGQYRRVRLFAGSVGVVFMALCGLLADLLTGGYGVVHLGEGVQFDTAVTALVFTMLFTGIASIIRRRSLGLHDEMAPTRLPFTAKRK